MFSSISQSGLFSGLFTALVLDLVTAGLGFELELEAAVVEVLGLWNVLTS